MTDREQVELLFGALQNLVEEVLPLAEGDISKPLEAALAEAISALDDVDDIWLGEKIEWEAWARGELDGDPAAGRGA